MDDPVVHVADILKAFRIVCVYARVDVHTCACACMCETSRELALTLVC